MTNKVLKKIDWDILNTYIGNNLIIANKHPDYNIWILNYSPKVQSKQIWDEYTMACKGLVVDEEGNILARPFVKFKKIEEYDPAEIQFSQFFDVFEKIDGSLIILFYYKPYKEWIVATRDSFISEPAKEAHKLITKDKLGPLEKDCTYLFEIIYPENRIVVDYGDKRDIILLARIETENNLELFYDDLKKKYSSYFTVVKRISIKSFKQLNELKENQQDNKEGFVVRFENGFRVKIKYDEYIKLHGIINNVSKLTVWEYLKNNYDFDELIGKVPDEFFSWLQKTKNQIQYEYNEIEKKALKEFIEIYLYKELTDKENFANFAKESKYRSILFKIYDNNPYDEIIWKMIKPDY